ncbi:hypothetical protein ROS1_57920 [Roseibium sp. ROS1]
MTEICNELSEITGSNLLYSVPELYQTVYPDGNHERVRLCLVQFQKYCRSLPTSVIDFGCGTGREVNALAALGVDAVGVDANAGMLRLAQKAGRGRFILGDVRKTRFDRQFSAALALGNIMSYLLTRNDIRAFLNNLVRHMLPQAILIVNISNAARFLDVASSHPEKTIKVQLPEGEATGRITYRIDRKLQRVHRERVWSINEQSVHVDKCSYRLFFPEEVAYVLETAGFEVLDMADNENMELSDFNGEEMTMVARFVGVQRISDVF